MDKIATIEIRWNDLFWHDEDLNSAIKRLRQVAESHRARVIVERRKLMPVRNMKKWLVVTPARNVGDTGVVRAMEHEGDYDKGDYIVSVEVDGAAPIIKVIFAEE